MKMSLVTFAVEANLQFNDLIEHFMFKIVAFAFNRKCSQLFTYLKKKHECDDVVCQLDVGNEISNSNAEMVILLVKIVDDNCG